jgi:hypothetical protein
VGEFEEYERQFEADSGASDGHRQDSPPDATIPRADSVDVAAIPPDARAARLNRARSHLICGWCDERIGEWLATADPGTGEVLQEVRLPEGMTFDSKIKAHRLSRGALARSGKAGAPRDPVTGAALPVSSRRYSLGEPIRRLASKRVKPGQILQSSSDSDFGIAGQLGSPPSNGTDVRQFHEQVAPPFDLICRYCGRRNCVRLDSGR